MIIIRLIGGLGNQLFQYAAAKALAEQHNTLLKLDVTSFTANQLRNFDLFHLQVSAAIASNEETMELKAFTATQRIKSYLTPYNKRKFYKQPYYHFDKNFFNLGDHVYLQGYFQSEKYFHSISNLIKDEYQINPKDVAPVQSFVSELKQNNSVAVHIRRGDYTNKETLKVHGILSLDYYRKAIGLLNEQYSNARFYVFTDDKEWVFKNLEIANATIVSGNISKTHFEDLYLMAHCKHNIIANSSFSWWSAWLNNHKNKSVIAPAQWFNKGPKDTYDLLPPGWTKI